MSDSATLTAARVPTVYFIDDSATMREVIKIAFRKENIHVVTCPDAASALAQFGENAPDAVITDVIMPEKDGYQVCDFIKHHEQLNGIPVILMSGVVNRNVAEKAMSVKADELIRKPFHPQDLIGRVKGLLAGKFSSIPMTAADSNRQLPAAAGPAPAQALTDFFATGPGGASSAVAPFGAAPEARPAVSRPAQPVAAVPVSSAPQRLAASTPSAAPVASSGDVQKLRNEIRMLELLVKKLQTQLDAAHEYSSSLEEHIKTLSE